MHMHNAWLLEKTNLTIDLPADYFVSPKHLFIFCGSLNLCELCDFHDTNHFDYHLFLFAASYLMINDSFLVILFKTSGSVNYKDNNNLLPALYSLLTLNFVLPQTLVWFESQFPNYNKTFVLSIVYLPFGAFHKHFLKYE